MRGPWSSVSLVLLAVRRGRVSVVTEPSNLPAQSPSTAPLRAVVTGASSGIGEACVRFLRARGWDVVAFARREDRLAEVAARTGAHPVVGDVTSPTTGCAPVRSATSARRSARRANATTSQPRARR